MPNINRPRDGWVPPGYNYLGPGNSLTNKKPTNKLDSAAMAHDKAYNKHIHRGENPYLKWVDADETFLKDISNIPGFMASTARALFKGKKWLLHRPTNHAPKRKHVPRHIFINRAKKQKLTIPSSQQTLDKYMDTDQNTEAAAETSNTTPTAGGGGGGGGGKGAGGVGYATGGFDNRTTYNFEGQFCYVTAKATRLIHLNMSDSEEYKTVQIVTATNQSANTDRAANDAFDDNICWMMKTPWFILDCNSWGIWFAPSDMQFILSLGGEMEILSLEQEIFNIVIKTVTETSTQPPTKLYNNDLTACLQVALDTNNTMPFTPQAPRGNTLGYYPWRPSVLPSWSYYLDWSFIINWRNQQTYDTGATFTANPHLFTNFPFYTIEQKCEIDMLRTGDTLNTGIYTFDCNKHKMLGNWQSTRQLGAPPFSDAQTDHNPLTLNRPFQKGIQWGQKTYSATAGLTQVPNEATHMRPYQIGYNPPTIQLINTRGGMSIVPIPPGAENDIEYPNANNGEYKYVYDYNHGNKEPEHQNQWTITHDGMTGQSMNVAANFGVADLHQTSTIKDNEFDVGGLSAISRNHISNTYSPYVGLDGPTIDYPWGMIWDKHPHTELRPRLNAQAPFTCKNNCPGQLFIKIAPNYTEELNPNTDAQPRIQSFANFYWTGTLKLKIRIRSNRQWNPHHLPNSEDVFQNQPDWQGRLDIPAFSDRTIQDLCY